MHDEHKILNDQELEQLVDEAWDHAFVKHGLKPVRADGKDSWGQIQHDFPDLFGLDQSV